MRLIKNMDMIQRLIDLERENNAHLPHPPPIGGALGPPP